MKKPEWSPDLLLAYLPHLDYDLQRHGPQSPQGMRAVKEIYAYLQRLEREAAASGYEVVFFGDYAMTSVTRPALYPNQVLSEAGLFTTRRVKGRLYPDFYAGQAWAMVDHEIAHVFTTHKTATDKARKILEKMPGIAAVLNREEQKKFNIDHPNSGELVLMAEEGGWFAYPWWTSKKEAPDFAGHVDIHLKPGYDPCELFWGVAAFSNQHEYRKNQGNPRSYRSGKRSCVGKFSQCLPTARQPAGAEQAGHGSL